MRIKTPKTSSALLRDEVLETAHASWCLSLFGLEAAIPISDEEAPADLLFGGLARFRSLGRCSRRLRSTGS